MPNSKFTKKDLVLLFSVFRDQLLRTDRNILKAPDHWFRQGKRRWICHFWSGTPRPKPIAEIGPYWPVFMFKTTPLWTSFLWKCLGVSGPTVSTEKSRADQTDLLLVQWLMSETALWNHTRAKWRKLLFNEPTCRDQFKGKVQDALCLSQMSSSHLYAILRWNPA